MNFPRGYENIDPKNANGECIALAAYHAFHNDIGKIPKSRKEIVGENYRYYIYPDGSLLFVNNGDDEVWKSYIDFQMQIEQDANDSHDALENLSDADKKMIAFEF